MMLKNSYSGLCLILAFAINIAGCKTSENKVEDSDRIQPYRSNPTYWQYLGKPMLLIGGSSDDNLFQHTYPDLDEELDRITASGGNYVRCTMSGRDLGNVYPFFLDTLTQMYDLNRWDDEYWRRFDYFLKATRDRKIIVQIEIWATYDFYTRDHHLWADGTYPWERNPFHPDRNINYTQRESGLPVIFRSTGTSLINPFFTTVLPRYDEVPPVLGFQQKFVDKLLSYSFKYDHVLYCMDNETNADPEWSSYWAEYVREKASEQGIKIEVTQAYDSFDPTDRAIKEARIQSPSSHFFTKRANVMVALKNPELYSFLEISNHNFQAGEIHYKTGYFIWKKVQESGILRPVNNVKIYGAGAGTGNNQDGVERFWRNVFAGSAAVRFHRPPWGLGSSDLALTQVKSMKMLTDSIEIYYCVPANELLSERSDNEAFCMANTKAQKYILYFPSSGNVNLNIKKGNYELRWLEIGTSTWKPATILTLPGIIQTPDNEPWALLVKNVNVRK